MNYVLLTGASSGVGRELAIYLSEFYPLILNGRDETRLNETKSRCKNEVLLWPYDLSRTDSVESDLASFIAENKVSISAFVHCAGLMKMLPLKNVSPQALQETYAVNVFAPELITKVLASKRINSKNLRSVVFISSNISMRGAKAFSVYGSSKAALDGVVRNLAVELAPDIRVNSILPGGMITEMTKELFEDEEIKNQFMKTYPLGIGEPSYIAPMVEFLISERAGWITGQQITIDGGRTTDITERR